MITETFHFTNHAVHEHEMGPMLVFKDVSPIYLKVNFHKWCEIGLSEIDRSRQAEIQAINLLKTEFLGLVDAVYFIAMTFRKEISNEDMRKSIHQYIDNYYKKDVKKEDILMAPDLCEAFFQKISFGSAKSLIFILMELAIVYCSKYEYHVDQSSILDLFERYSVIIITGHDWKKLNKKYDPPNKRPGSQIKKDKKG